MQKMNSPRYREKIYGKYVEIQTTYLEYPNEEEYLRKKAICYKL